MKYIIELNITFSPKEKKLSLLNENSNSITLSNQAARLLLEMVTNPNTLLNRGELIKKVWEDYGFTSSNNSLNVAISEIRKAFSSLGKDPKIICTIPKAGFRLDARVEPAIKIREEKEHNERLHIKNNTEGNNKKKKVEHAAIFISVVCFFLVTIIVLCSSTYSSKLKIKNEGMDLIYTDSKCRVYNMDNNNKNLDIEQVKKEVSHVIKNCDLDRIDVYYKKMYSNTVNSTTFIGYCTLEGDKYKNCLTYRNNTGYVN